MQADNPLARVAAAPEVSALAGASSYDLYLNGVLLGSATLELTRQGQEYILQVVGKVRSLISSMFTIRYRGRGVMSPSPVRPSAALIEEQKGSKMKTYQLQFPEPNRAVSLQVEEKPGKAPIRSHQEFVSEKVVLDPFSTVFFIRNRNWRVGEAEVFDFLTGKKQYELRLHCRGEKSLTIDGSPRKTWEIAVESRSLEAPGKIKLTGVIYLAQDSRREILKINGRHRLGRIAADLRGSGVAELR